MAYIWIMKKGTSSLIFVKTLLLINCIQVTSIIKKHIQENVIHLMATDGIIHIAVYTAEKRGSILWKK